MDVLRLAAISLLTLLSACSSVEPKYTLQEMELQQRATMLLADYNARHSTHYPAPTLSVDPQLEASGVVASADYALWTIKVNAQWVEKDFCLVYKEAVAHELAHLLLNFQQYGSPQTAVVTTRTGTEIVAFNGPTALRDSDEEHGPDWQAMARDLGADPCKEGYCRDPRPYSKYPLTCSAGSAAVASVRTLPKGTATPAPLPTPARSRTKKGP